MRTHIFDYEEFPNTSTEEMLTVSVATKKELEAFGGDTNESLAEYFFKCCDWEHSGEFPKEVSRAPFAKYFYASTVCEYLQRFVPTLDIPIRETEVIEITNEPGDLEIILVTPNQLVCYYWNTTA